MFEAQRYTHYVYALVLCTGLQTVCQQVGIDSTTAAQAKLATIASAFEKGVILFGQKQFKEALANFDYVISLKPDCVEAHFNNSLIHVMNKDYQQAIYSLTQTTTHDPKHSKAWWLLANVYGELKQRGLEIDALKRVTELEPDHCDAHLLLARAAAQENRIAQSLEHYNRALQLRPNDAYINFETANILVKVSSLNNALILFQRAIDLAPTLTEAVLSVAHILRYQGRMKEAVPYYRHVLNEWPENQAAHCGLADAYLSSGNFKEGLEEHEWRLKQATNRCNLLKNFWHNEDLTNKAILVRAENEMADTIFGMRYCKKLKAMGAHVIVEASDALLPLLDLCPYIDQLVSIATHTRQLPTFDYQIPVMSLPRAFQTDWETIPHEIPYLYLPQALSTRWETHLSKDTQFKVGICWKDPNDQQTERNIALKEIVPLFDVPRVSFYNLQHPVDTNEISYLPETAKLHILPELEKASLLDVGAVIQNLDIIITNDSTIAHLAAALGKETWIILPKSAQWRWFQNRENSPWYPSARLFRQCRQNEWSDVVTLVRNELAARATAQQGSILVHSPVSVGELVDKITILMIKEERIADPEKVAHVKTELQHLRETFMSKVKQSARLNNLLYELLEVNKRLWDIEDDIRDKERNKTFDDGFIALARSVYIENDERFTIKRQINELLGSQIVEVKSYKPY